MSVNVAMTADGKLAPATRHFVPFTTKKDQQMMLELRAEFDAVMSGAKAAKKSQWTKKPSVGKPTG